MKILPTENGSHANLHKMCKFSLRFVLWMAFAAITTVGIGSVYAWNMHEAQQVNILQSRNVSVGIDETFPDDTVEPDATKEKKVRFSNPSSAAVFLRVSYTETWENGSEWLQDDGTHAIKNWTTEWSSEWWDGGDGWFYYKKVLPAGGSTADVLSSVSFPADLESEYADGKYSLAFMAEVIQLSDEEAVNTDVANTIFGKKAVVNITSTVSGAVTAGTVSWSD